MVSEDDMSSEEEVLVDLDEDSQFVDEKSEEEKYELKWSKRLAQVNVADFTQPSGPTHVLTAQQSVKSFFELVFSKKVLHLIVSQTNLYAQQRIITEPDPVWKPLALGELKAWIGCLLVMALDKKPKLQMYWDYVWKSSLVADRFTRDRFFAIKKYLHLADNSIMADSKSPNFDRLAKIRPLMNLLQKNFQSQYRPYRYLTADEDICKFKGRNFMKQYLRAKIVKWGYRIWKLCDAGNAYVLNFDVYSGAGSETSLPHSVVMKLMEGYLDKNHVVIMDNFFTSIPLFSDLLSRSTYACGTVRANRKYFPEDFKNDEDMEPGESEYWQSDNFVATIWQDKRAVRFLSTCCEAEGDDEVKRRKKNYESLSLSCPPVVKLYSQGMGGVDRSDRMVRTYTVSRKSKKWWFRLFYYFLDMSVANSYILYQNSPNHSGLSELDYIKVLALELIATSLKDSKVQPGPQRKTRKAATIPRFSSGNHWPVKTNQRLKCQQCSGGKRKRCRSYYACEACGVHLCVDTCFKRYHTSH
jgi:hypothetical protein